MVFRYCSTFPETAASHAWGLRAAADGGRRTAPGTWLAPAPLVSRADPLSKPVTASGCSAASACPSGRRRLRSAGRRRRPAVAGRHGLAISIPWRGDAAGTALGLGRPARRADDGERTGRPGAALGAEVPRQGDCGATGDRAVRSHSQGTCVVWVGDDGRASRFRGGQLRWCELKWCGTGRIVLRPPSTRCARKPRLIA